MGVFMDTISLIHFLEPKSSGSGGRLRDAREHQPPGCCGLAASCPTWHGTGGQENHTFTNQCTGVVKCPMLGILDITL